MISLEMLPAAHGDALWIEYGTASETRRILIDGGPARTYETGLQKRIQKLSKAERVFELFVVTHIDADHIDGVLIFLQDIKADPAKAFQIKDLWFNGWTQLAQAKPDNFGALQGEFLGAFLTLDADLKRVWNQKFGKGKNPAAVPAPADESDKLPVYDFEGGARLTLLGPTDREIERLRARWASAIRDFMPGDVHEAIRRLEARRDYRPPSTPAVFSAKQYGSDRSPANGSSISFVLEYDGVSILLPGDAHARTLEETLARLAAERSVKRLRFDAVKLPHHGSMGNVTEKWLQMVDCDRWLISTNGAIFGHPDLETMELIAAHNLRTPTFYCNYRSDTTQRLTPDKRWNVVFPEKDFLAPAGGLLLKMGEPERARAPKKTGAGGAKRGAARRV